MLWAKCETGDKWHAMPSKAPEKGPLEKGWT